jgi:hypothetical protein
MTFDEQCGYYAAIQSKVPLLIVAKVAGISHTVASYLKAAGERRGGQTRYPKVAREYAALGHEAFIHKYLNPRLRHDLIEAIDERKREHDAKRLKAQGIPANVMRYCRRYVWEKTQFGQPAIFVIDQRGDGFRWRNLKPFYDQPEYPVDKQPLLSWQGDFENDAPFATPVDCFRYLRDFYKPYD